MERLKIELARYPGLRQSILERRFAGAKPFTYYPSDLGDREYGPDGGLWDPRQRGAAPEEQRCLDACYAFISEFLNSSSENHFLVQCDYRRLATRGDNGLIRTGHGERLLVIDHASTLGGSEFQAEVWVDVFGCFAGREDIDLTLARGSLHPRALGVLATLPDGYPAAASGEALSEMIVRGARYLVYDAFDGQWLLFAELFAANREEDWAKPG